MKYVNYELNKNDIEAIAAALAILPEYDFAGQADFQPLTTLCASAGSKLILDKKLTVQEMCLVAMAVDCAYKALRNEISLSDEAKFKIKDFIFVYNKLEPVFSPFLGM